MQSVILFILNAVPMSGYRTYVAAVIALIVAAYLIWTGDVSNGVELGLVAVMFFFKRASDDKLMDALTKATDKQLGGPQ